jgi:hypothetical protein
MPADQNGAPAPLPTSRSELIRYLEAAIPLTEAQDATAVFLLRLVLKILGDWNDQQRR